MNYLNIPPFFRGDNFWKKLLRASSNLNIPPFFRGDDLQCAISLSEEPSEFGDFVLVQNKTRYLMMRMADEHVSLAQTFFVVNPSLAAFALRKGDNLMVSQSQGKPVLTSLSSLSTPLSEALRLKQFDIPLLAFGGLAGDRWLRFVFTRNPHSLSDYGWIAEETSENPLTPEWASVILSHGQEISHA